jgi:hypothetical protein
LYASLLALRLYVQYKILAYAQSEEYRIRKRTIDADIDAVDKDLMEGIFNSLIEAQAREKIELDQASIFLPTANAGGDAR